MSQSRLVSVVFVIIISFVFAGPAFAGKAEKKKKDDHLSEVLGKIKWGDSKKTVLSKIKKQGMEELKRDPKLKSDRVKLQRARKKLFDRVERAEKSWTRLEGDHGYGLSVVTDEFSNDNGEAFLRFKDKVAQRFYFFTGGKFYKLVVAYNPNYVQRTDFEGFVGSSVQKYGRPTVAEYDDVSGKDVLALVRWESPEVSLAVRNKKELFDTYTMSFADRQTIKRLEASGRRLGGNDKDEDEISAAVAGLMEGGDYDANESAVDSLVGNTSVDLSKGRPKDDEARKYTGGEDEPASKDTKKKKKKKKKKKRKTKKAPDFGNLSTKASDDLIIY